MTILVDLGNVLLKFDPINLLKQYSDDTLQVQRLFEALFSKMWYQLDEGSIEFEEVLFELKQKLTEDDFRVIETFMHTWFEHMVPIEGMEEVLIDLKRKGHKLILCSNTSLQFRLYQNRFSILKHIDAFVISAEIKASKPHKQYYEYVLDTHQLQASTCFFIDDMKRNTEAAEQLGVKSYVFDGDYRKLRQRLIENQIL